MDPRIRLNEIRDGNEQGVYALGKRHANMPTAEAYCAAAIERRERIAGRKLTAAEIERPPRKQGTAQEQADYANWRPTPVTAEVEKRDPMDDLDGVESSFHGVDADIRRIRGARKALHKQAKEQYEARIAGESPQSISDERQQAIEWADSYFESVAWNPNSTYADVVAAEKLQRQAYGDLGAFRTMADATTAMQNERIAEQRAAAELAREQAAAHVASFQPVASFGSPKPTPSGLTPGSEVRRWSRTDGTSGYDVLAPKGIGPGREVLASYSEADAPAEVVAASN
jgi:hypothetical protein